MAFKRKTHQLKPGEICPPLSEMVPGTQYIAAVPLREFKWRAVSDCCQSRILRDVFEEAAVGEDGESVGERINIPTCFKCKLPCDKQWKTISRLIASLSRKDDQKWHKMDQF